MPSQCPYCGAPEFHQGRSSLQFQCRTTTYADGPASRSKECTLAAALNAMTAERDALRAQLAARVVVPDPLAWMHRRILPSGASYYFVLPSEEEVRAETEQHGGETIALYPAARALDPATECVVGRERFEGLGCLEAACRIAVDEVVESGECDMSRIRECVVALRERGE